MSEEYETTLEIINNEKEDLSFKEIANRLENKETELKGKAITDETTNLAGTRCGGRGGFKGPRGPDGGCDTCGGPYCKKQCHEWHNTDEGRKWLVSDERKYHLMGQKLKAQRISEKSETAEEDAKMARFQELSDSESGYTSACSKSPDTVMMSKATVPQ